MSKCALTGCLLIALALPVAAQPPLDLMLIDIGATASTILAMRNANDGSGRLFLVERAGTIEIFQAGGVLGTPFLDIGVNVDETSEGGLLGLAFHPDFTTNGYFFVYYTRTGTGGDVLETVVERFTVSAGDPNQANLASRREVFTLGQPAGNHNGGDIHFGPDGFLYIGLGDGGASSSTAQDINNLLGKMLRIDPCDDLACTPPHTIPPDNPLVGVPGDDEIWAWGLRNPYRWSFDRDTGDMFIADVGASKREEVDFQPAATAGGENYGWNCREGDIAGPGGCDPPRVEPIIVYGHVDDNCSITGGYRYRGCIRGLRGTYVFGDFCSARIWFGKEDSPGIWSFGEWANRNGSIYGFGEDEDGELYMSQGDAIYRFESASDCRVFEDGFESGDTSAWSAIVP